jgi:hypothetical protein
MGLSGSWLDNWVVSNVRNALGPSWLVIAASCDDDDDVLAVVPVADDPLLIKL